MTKVFLIVGFGSIGLRHYNNIKMLYHDSKIISLKRSKQTSEINKNLDLVEVYSMEDALKHNPQFAIISSPAPFHLKIARVLLENKVHLLIEKPISHDLNEAIEFLSFAKNYPDTKVIIGYNFRFSTAANKFKKLIESNHIGRVLNIQIEMGSYLPNWRPQQDYRESVSAKKEFGGGVLLELSHAVDLFYWFLGMPTKVLALSRTVSDLEIEVEDCVDVLLEIKKEKIITGHIHLDMIQRRASRFFKIIGTEGSLFWNMITNEIIFTDDKEEKALPSDVQEVWNDMYVNELEHFVSSVEKKTKEKLSVYDGVQSLKIIHAINESSSAECAVYLAGE